MSDERRKVSNKPEWYDSASFKFVNCYSESWAAQFRVEDDSLFVDVCGADIDYEIRSVRLFQGMKKCSPLQLAEGLGLIGSQGERTFFSAVMYVAQEKLDMLVSPRRRS
jgi:hypothetical protein